MRCIVWGGFFVNVSGAPIFNTGGRYCAQSGAPTPTPTPTPGPIQLRGQGKKVGGINTSRLKWRGATSANVDVYRDGVVIATTPNDGLYDDSTGTTGQASFTYQVCEAGSQTCSNEVTVNFPPSVINRSGPLHRLVSRGSGRRRGAFPGRFKHCSQVSTVSPPHARAVYPPVSTVRLISRRGQNYYEF